MKEIERNFIRDGRAPIPINPATSRVMSANKAKNTGPEILLRKALRRNGFTKFKTNWEGAPGRPDVAFLKEKIAIFVHGCYWHRCPFCKKGLPKSNKEFWSKKFRKNKRRDLKKVLELQRAGWSVLTFWECKVKADANGLLGELNDLFKSHS